ncbi:hypothetical protein V6N12_024270 [Hibiscus sabdariffa]|uniref:Secreted protein n=1 Tax=Hibiscus sabdariffa TaxID=183260 RepID=A0ABR2G067_9ROSI
MSVCLLFFFCHGCGVIGHSVSASQRGVAQVCGRTRYYEESPSGVPRKDIGRSNSVPKSDKVLVDTSSDTI